jgi:hypothetical protein
MNTNLFLQDANFNNTIDKGIAKLRNIILETLGLIRKIRLFI